MLVATGSLNIGGRSPAYGEPIPEALEWSPYILSIHKSAGRIRDVSDAEAAEMAARHAEKVRQATEQSAQRAVADARIVANSARQELQRLDGERSRAEKHSDASELALTLAEDLYRELRLDVAPTESSPQADAADNSAGHGDMYDSALVDSAAPTKKSTPRGDSKPSKGRRGSR